MAGKMVRKVVATQLAPKALGPYSQAVIANGTMYISGCLGINPETNELLSGVEGECRQAMTNMGNVLAAAGATFDNVVKTTILLSDIGNFSAVNDVYKDFFKSHYPARACYQVACLPKNALIEIEAVAVLGDVIDE